MRARLPDQAGFLERDGVRVAYEVHGEGERTILFVPPSPITHSRSWKGQVHYLSRHFRVVTMDGRGNGLSDRPRAAGAYLPTEIADDIAAVIREVGAAQAVLVAHCHANYWAFLAAASNPDLIAGLVAIAPGIPALGDPNTNWIEVAQHWDEDPENPQGWLMCNPAYWRRGGYENWIRFWFTTLGVEPHSTKPVEDMVAWAMETDPETMIQGDEEEAPGASTEQSEDLCRSLRCPVLVLHGSEDRCQMPTRGERVAELTRGQFVLMEGVGHLAPGREPVLVNRHIKSFVDSIGGTPMQKETWTRGRNRPRKALYVSSPIGLGHARRDVAIAEELSQLNPDLKIEWLAQSPVTDVLEAEGHTIHPASRYLASESTHWASEASGHELNAFQALRRMDEILVANFMVFQEVVEDGAYDVVVADEAWDIDHFWHENPELKRGSHVWITDFVGFLPMPEGGDREAYLTADYNAEMIEHIARFPRIRDRSVFVGNPEDVIPESFGPGLPDIRQWTMDHFAFSGYITGFTPPSADEVVEMRQNLGYREGEKICLVTVGGSGVGQALLQKVIEAYPYAAKEIADLRMVVVAGPRIMPESLIVPDGVEVVGYVDRLHRHLSVCDLAVVQGGLTTTMELAAARRPFLYFPLRNHFEQNYHVRYRLERHRAGRFMEYDQSDPEDIAAAMAAEMTRQIDYLPIETDGAARAARLISDLI
ncbi:MAG TPA: alpha/beta fold hydrolase [Acidimicrobiia bacterium]|nr:alpha/beta fold hydrolase [Acidimicrobiia bacterium]